MRHRMHDAEQRVGEGHAGQALRVVHTVARFHIAVVGLDQQLVDHLNRIQRERVGIIAVERGNICLDGVRHRVHTRVGRQLLRHRLREVGIDDGHVRRDVEIGQRILDALLVVGDDRERGDLRRRARGGRDGAELRLRAQRREIERRAERVERRVGIFVEGPHRLRSVNRRTAADGDDPIGLELAHRLGALHNRFHGGIRLHALEQTNLKAGFLQIGLHPVQKTELLHAAAADDDDRARAAERFQHLQRAFSMIQVSR